MTSFADILKTFPAIDDIAAINLYQAGEYEPAAVIENQPGKAGSVAVINGCCWHGGTVNRSGASRRVLHLAIGRRDVPQQTVEKQYLTKTLYDRATPAMRYLLDIEDTDPVVFGYPPLPDKAPTWVAIGSDGARHH